MSWLWYALFTTIAWGVWGSLIEIPDQKGFPATYGYVVWALTMVPCALFALMQRGWHWRSVSFGTFWRACMVGLLGAGGQLVLFQALRSAPAYIVFPIVSLYPIVTILLSVTLLHEHANRKQWIGLALALPAMALIYFTKDTELPAKDAVKVGGYVLFTLAAFLAWGLQAYYMKSTTQHMSPEGLFVYMAAAAVLLIPGALWMTEKYVPVEWSLSAGWKSPWVVAGIQILNAIGALTFVHAMRKGKALIVTPMTALAPVLTVIISLAIVHSKAPSIPQGIGFVFAAIAIYLLAE